MTGRKSPLKIWSSCWTHHWWPLVDDELILRSINTSHLWSSNNTKHFWYHCQERNWLTLIVFSSFENGYVWLVSTCQKILPIIQNNLREESSLVLFLCKWSSRHLIRSNLQRQAPSQWLRRSSVITWLHMLPTCPSDPFSNTGDANFQIKTGLIILMQASSSCGKADEDVDAHLQQFLELYDTIVIRVVTQNAIRLQLFQLSTWYIETLVLLQEKCRGHMREVINSVPHVVLSDGQIQRPSGKYFDLLASSKWVNSRGMGNTSWVHPGLSAPWDGWLAHCPELLQQDDSCSLWSHRQCCWRSLLLTDCCLCYRFDWEDGLQPREERITTPTSSLGHEHS